jgi:hypothetical protein
MRILTLFILTLSTVFAYAEESTENFVFRRDSTMPLEDQTVDEEGLKIMWWNMGCSSTKGLAELSESDRAFIDPINQWENLKQIVNSERLIPDVLILGEYCPSAFDDKTYKLIKSKYKSVYRLDKSNPLYRIRNGVRVFSKLKIENIKEEILKAEEFRDSEIMQNCDDAVKKRNPKSFGEKTYWNRPKISFTVEHNRRDYKIVPVHLANPWPLVKACVGLWSTPGAIKNDVENANYVQAAQLVDSFQDGESTLVIGDFNAPKSILGGTSNTYHILSQGFGPSVVESEDYTYSDPRRNFPAYSIDHAFASGDLNVKKGVVLPFAGSDHLPLYIVIGQ